MSELRRCTLYFLHLFQLYYRLRVSKKQVYHREVTSVHAAYSIFYTCIWSVVANMLAACTEVTSWWWTYSISVSLKGVQLIALNYYECRLQYYSETHRSTANWRWSTKTVSVTQYHLLFVPESSTTQHQTSNVTPEFLPADHSRTRWYWLRGKKTRKCSWLGYSLQLRSGTCLPSARAYRPEHLRKN